MIPSDWYGAKRYVKRALSLGPVNRVLVGALRHATPTSTIARLPVSVPEVDAHVRGHRFTMVDPDKCSIAKELYWGRGERVRADEKLALELFVDLARSADVVMDIGANTGVFSLCAALASPTADVRAFEIVPEVFDVLLRNIVRNDLAHRIECRLEAIAAIDTILRVPAFAKTSSLPTSASIIDQPSAGTRIRCTSLDEALKDVRGRVLMKIDVEGGEDVLFQHGGSALRRLGPDIVCEVLPGTDPSNVVARTMREHEYHLYRIEDGHLHEMSTLAPSRTFHDWLFSKKDAAALGASTSIPIRRD
jgi:FkbM family methyltransferase